MPQHNCRPQTTIAKARHASARQALQAVLWFGWLAIGVNAWLISRL